MSARDVALVLNHSQASGTEKVVLLGIAWHSADTGSAGAFPSIERLANYAKVSTRTVIRSIAALEELGELDVDRHSGRSYGGPKTNRYWIMLDCPSNCDGTIYHNDFLELEPKFKVVDNPVEKNDTRDIHDTVGDIYDLNR
jgi:hypothetical protein